MAQEGSAPQASIGMVGSQEGRLSKLTPPLQELPVLQPYIHAGSNMMALLKLVPPPGHNCALEGRLNHSSTDDMMAILITPYLQLN